MTISERRYCDDHGEETLHVLHHVGPFAREVWHCQPCRVEWELEVFGGESA